MRAANVIEARCAHDVSHESSARATILLASRLVDISSSIRSTCIVEAMKRESNDWIAAGELYFSPPCVLHRTSRAVWLVQDLGGCVVVQAVPNPF